MRLIVCMTLAAILAGSTQVRADVASAREHYQKGKVYYDLQRYLEAAKEYELAYEAKDDPALLFNIGQSYRLGGENAKALGAYRSFLRNVPNAPNRAEIEARIADLQQRLADEQKKAREAASSQASAPVIPPPTEATSKPSVATPPAPISPPIAISNPPRERSARVKTIAGIAVGSLGIAALAGGLALELVAKSDNDKFAHPAKGTVFDPSLEASVKNNQTAGIALLAVGAAGLVTGITLLVLGTRDRHTALKVLAPTFGPGFAGALLYSAF